MKTLLNLFLSMSLMFNCRASLQRSHTLSTIEEVDENLEIKLECIDNVKQYLAEQNPDGTRNVRLIFGVSANEEDIKRFDENSENYINIFLDQHKSCDDPRQLAIDAGKLNHNIDLLLSFKKTFDVVTFDFSTTKMFLHSWTTDYLSIIKDSLKKNGKLIIPFDSNYWSIYRGDFYDCKNIKECQKKLVNALSFKSKKLISGTQQTIISNCDVVYDLFESEIIKATTAEQKELKLEQEYFKMFKRISQKGDRKLFEDTFNRLKNEENYHFEYLFEQVISEQLNEKRIFAQSDSIQKILLEAFSSDLLIQQNIKTLEKVFDKKYIKFEKDSNMEFRARENELKSPIPYKIIATKN